MQAQLTLPLMVPSLYSFSQGDICMAYELFSEVLSVGIVYVGVGIIRSPPQRRRGGAVVVVGRPPKRQRVLTEAFKSPVKARCGTCIRVYSLRQAVCALLWQSISGLPPQHMMGDGHSSEAQALHVKSHV